MTSFQKWSAEDGAVPPIPAGYGGRFAVSLSAHDINNLPFCLFVI
nr:MAG TPA: hypothetical protein [Caudoviricetes sp.]